MSRPGTLSDCDLGCSRDMLHSKPSTHLELCSLNITSLMCGNHFPSSLGAEWVYVCVQKHNEGKNQNQSKNNFMQCVCVLFSM